MYDYYSYKVKKVIKFIPKIIFKILRKLKKN